MNLRLIQFWHCVSVAGERNWLAQSGSCSTVKEGISLELINECKVQPQSMIFIGCEKSARPFPAFSFPGLDIPNCFHKNNSLFNYFLIAPETGKCNVSRKNTVLCIGRNNDSPLAFNCILLHAFQKRNHLLFISPGAGCFAPEKSKRAKKKTCCL